MKCLSVYCSKWHLVFMNAVGFFQVGVQSVSDIAGPYWEFPPICRWDQGGKMLSIQRLINSLHGDCLKSLLFIYHGYAKVCLSVLSGEKEWVKNKDYYRLDGNTSACARKRWVQEFNNTKNIRYTQFKSHLSCLHFLSWLLLFPLFQGKVVSDLHSCGVIGNQSGRFKPGRGVWRLLESVIWHPEHLQGLSLWAEKNCICVPFSGPGIHIQMTDSREGLKFVKKKIYIIQAFYI